MPRRQWLRIILYALMGVAAMSWWYFPSASRDQARIRTRMAEYDNDLRAMNADGIARLFTADGELWNAGTLLKRGPDAIRAFLHSFDGQVRIESQQTTVDRVVIDGDRATSYGTYRQTARLLKDNSILNVTGEIRVDWIQCKPATWCVRRLETTPR
jgi:ketosteroid isomerase-like protein